MSFACRMLFVLCALTALVFPLVAAPPTKPDDRQVAKWIKELGDGDFATRENASRKLWLAGEVAEAALEKAAKSDDAEVIRRARDILDKFRWGIYPNTPADILVRIQAYQTSDGKQRLEIVQKLLQVGPAGLKAVLNISKAEKDPNQRKELGQLVSSKLLTIFQQVLETNDYEPFEALLELGHESEFIKNDQYTAYWLLRGKLDERIAYFRALLAKTPTEKRLAETLAYLYRAKGDLTEARKAAEKSGRADLIEGILYEAADWKALAARPMGTDVSVEKWAYRAAFARLAGNQKDFEAVLDKLHQLAEKGSQSTVVNAFLLNDRQADGLALLRKLPNHGGVLFDILCERREYDKARELVESSQRGANKIYALTYKWARVLALLGEKEKAEALFAAGSEEIKDGVSDYWAMQFLREESRAGLKELAFEHCSKLFSVAARKTVASGAGSPWECLFFSYLFPKQADTAEIWWIVLREKFKEESTPKTLKRLRQVMEGKIPAKEIKAWLQESELILSRPNLRIPTKRLPVYRQLLAEEAAKAGLDDLAYPLLEKADTAETLLSLGDLLAGKKQWMKAAERYRQAWRKNQMANRPFPGDNPPDPLPLYLAGDALGKAGQDEEGRKLIEQSHWVVLANASKRFTFLRDLAKRGHREAAQRETELLLRVSEPNTYYFSQAIDRIAVAAAARKDFAKAAEGFEQSMLPCLDGTTYFLNFGAYATMPAHVHQMRASALLAAGKHAEASQHIELAQVTSPGGVELAISLVPDLDKGGHNKEATTLFAKSFAVYEKVCQDYPRCSWAHNSAAYLCAGCRRDLDKGLTHARRAVELAPTNAGYLDTLAEVHFQRGDRDKAIAAEKRAIELEPKKTSYRKQLKRLQAGERGIERPPEDDQALRLRQAFRHRALDE